jgi:hypothetical protein
VPDLPGFMQYAVVRRNCAGCRAGAGRRRAAAGGGAAGSGVAPAEGPGPTGAESFSCARRPCRRSSRRCGRWVTRRCSTTCRPPEVDLAPAEVARGQRAEVVADDVGRRPQLDQGGVPPGRFQRTTGAKIGPDVADAAVRAQPGGQAGDAFLSDGSLICCTFLISSTGHPWPGSRGNVRNPGRRGASPEGGGRVEYRCAASPHPKVLPGRPADPPTSAGESLARPAWATRCCLHRGFVRRWHYLASLDRSRPCAPSPLAALH